VLSVIVFLADKGAQADTETEGVVFGGLAVVAALAVQHVDPWLCVPAFRRVCLYRTDGLKGSNKTSLVLFQARRKYRSGLLIFGGLAVVAALAVQL
jgi:hypothetical protein